MAASKFPDEKELHDFVTSGHAQDILLSINSLRKNKKLCDVVLIVENKEFPAHRIVLAACSDYFCAMFTSDMAESQESKVTLKGLSADIMEVLLDFVYTESVKVSVENVQALLPAACLLQLTGVKNACCEFLELQLHPSNCLGIKKFAETHGCHGLEKAANNYVHKHFIDVVDSEEFVLLSNSDVEQLIQNDYLTLPSEAAVFEALMQWIAHEEEERKDHLPQLLQHIRLPLLTPKYLTDTVDNEPLIRRNLDCRDLVDEAKKFHLRPECRHEMQSERTKPRLGLSEVLYVLGGFGSYQSPIDLVEKFDPQKNEWNVVAPMSRKRRYLCSVALGKKVYAIGGYDASSRLNAVECLDINNNCWTQLATMIHRRGLAGATTLGGKIYVAGGYDGALRHASVECYDPTIDQWSLVSEMSMTREGAGLTNMDGVLYCVGGYDGTSILNGVERFDPRTGQWAQVAAMTTRRSGAGIAVVDSQLYALGGYDGTQHLSTVECFSPCTNQWRSLADMNSKRCYVGSTTVGSKVYAVGGYDGTALLDTVESFDVRREEWTLLSSMTTKRCDMGVAVVSEH